MTENEWTDFDKGVDTMDETDLRVALKYMAREGHKLDVALAEHDLRKEMMELLGPMENDHSALIDSIAHPS